MSQSEMDEFLGKGRAVALRGLSGIESDGCADRPAGMIDDQLSAVVRVEAIEPAASSPGSMRSYAS